MANDQEILYDELANLPALEEQKKKIFKIFDDIESRIQKLNDAGVTIDQANGLKGLNDGVRKQKKAQDELSLSIEAYNNILTQNARLEAQMSAGKSEQAKKLSQLRVVQQELNKENKEAAKNALGLNDAYSKLAKEYEKAARTAQNLLILNGKDAEATKQAISRAQKLGQELKDTDAQVLKFQRNVGNYANSLADGFELVRREISRLQKDQAKFTIGGDTRSAEAAGLRIKELDDIIKISFDDTKNFGQVVSSLQKSFSTLATNGNQSNEFLKEYKQFVADAKDRSEDLKQEIKALSSDTRKLDLLAGSVSFVADSFQLAAGAAQLAGASEEDAAAATAKLVAVQSVANGIKGIANELTTKGTAANKVYAFVQALVATSLDKTAAAGTRAKAALGLLGIAVTVIGAVAIALAAFSRKADEAAINQKNFNDALKEAGTEYAKAIEQVNTLKNNVDLAKKGFISKTEVVKQYNEGMGKVTGQARDLNEVEQLLNDKAPAYIAFTFAKATATAALAKASQLAVEKQLELLQGPDKEAAKLFKSLTFGSVSDADINKAAEEDFNKRVAALDKQIEALKSYSIKQQAEAAEIAKKFKLNFFGTDGDDKGGQSNTSNVNERNKQAALQRNKIELEAAADIQKQILEIESFGFEARQKALKEYIRIKTRILDEERAAELKSKGLSGSQIKEIEETGKLKVATAKISNEEIALLEAKRLNDINKLNDEAIKLFTTTAKESIAIAIDEMGVLPDEVQAVFDKMNKELEEGAKNLLGELTDLQIQAIEKVTKAFAVKDQLQEVENNFIDTFQTIASTSNDLLGGIFDRQKNIIQEQIDDIERLKQAEIDRATAQQRNADGSIITEEQRAARIKIIEAKAQNDREKLELRQRQLDRQKAIAAKALNIFQLTVDGIQAVNKQRLILAEIKAKMAAAGPLGPALFGPALGIAASQLFQTIITSGAAVALAAAAPIPKFATGKDANDPYEGVGLVGEAGRELGISKSGKVSLYTKPTLTNLVKGDVILPNKVTEDVLAAISLTQLAQLNGVNVQNQETVDIKEVVKQLKELNKKSRIIINVQRGFETTAEFDYHMKH